MKITKKYLKNLNHAEFCKILKWIFDIQEERFLACKRYTGKKQ